MTDLSRIKQIPIIDVAEHLGISVQGTKAMCFMGHDKASPSLSFLKSRNTWRCFGACGKHGDAIALVMEKEKIDFKSALAWFARHFEFEIKSTDDSLSASKLHSENPATVSARQRPENATAFATDTELYSWLVNHCPKISSTKGSHYIESHGISTETANRFKLRELVDPQSVFTRLVDKWGSQRVYRSGIVWGKDTNPERLIWGTPAILFPFLKNGSIIYIQARMFEGGRKYLNLRGIEKPMFNTDCLSTLPPESVVHICEGVPDTIALESCGLRAVGVLGATSFRPDWVNEFLKFQVEVIGQGDSAGEMFTKGISNFFRTHGKSVRCVHLPKGKDAADILSTRDKSKPSSFHFAEII